MNKRTRQLNQALVKIAARPVPVQQPEILQNIVGLVEQLPVETIEIAQIARIQLLAGEPCHHLRHFAALMRHGG